jgi:hypothetical protein
MSDWKLLNTSTASGASSVSFTDLTGYKIFKFVFIDVNPATDVQKLTFQTSTDGGSSYGVTVTSTAFRAYHSESGSESALEYDGGNDLAQSTSFNPLTSTIGNGADESASGQLFLYNPASTTYVKHWMSTFSCYEAGSYEMNQYHAGYFNTTTAINAIQFKMGSGNLDAVIKQYGLVAS